MNGMTPLETFGTWSIALFWSLAYIFIILKGFKDKALAMPWPALCMNITWELLFAFVYPSPTPQWYINAAWFVLDAAILIQAILYGAKDFTASLSRKLFYPLLTLGMVVSFFGISAAAERFPDTAANYGGFLVNIPMSALFIAMLIRRGSTRGQGMYIALFKLLGSLFAYLCLFRWPYMTALYLPIFLLDVTYCVKLYKKLREEGLSPWRLGGGVTMPLSSNPLPYSPQRK